MRRRGGAFAWLVRLTALHVGPPVRLAGYGKDEGEFKPCSADGCSGTMKQTERRGKRVWLCQRKVSHTEDVIAKP
jgi:hypothetical protein